MRPRLIAIDMDGTLLGSDGRVSERNLAALRRAEAEGVEIVIATGRRHAYAMKVLRDLGLNPGNALVSSNGTVIRTVGSELLHRNHLPVETVRWLLEEIAGFRNTLVLTFDTTGPDGDDTRGALVCENLDELHTSIGGWMRANEPYILHVPRMEAVLEPHAVTGLPPVPPIQAMLAGTVERMNLAEKHLASHPRVAAIGQEEFPGCEIVLHRTSYPERDLAIVDILPAGCSKATALGRLAAMRGCTLAETLAIGDNWNDLPLLREAGRAVLMGNAPEELRRLAAELGWTVGPTHDEHGVAVAIESALA